MIHLRIRFIVSPQDELQALELQHFA